MTSLSPAIKRLQQDLKELKETPIVGANAEPFSDQDLTIWYGIVIGSEGSLLSGIPIRFCLEFPNEYPNEPPKAYFETYISYQNGVQIYDSKQRIEVCLNIFGNFRDYHSEWGSDTDGWTPSYTVSTILVSIQALMMSEMLSNRLHDVKEMTDSALNFHCSITGHKGSDSKSWFPQVITDPVVAKAISDKYRKPIQTVLETFYICYANSQLNGNNSVLGYGIHVENPRSGMLTSPCEYLSSVSFKTGNIRKSSTNLPFEYWLPILVRNEDWTIKRKIRTGFMIHVDQICKDIKYEGTSYQKAFKVCSSLMNGLVVQIMNNGADTTANDKFINGYFAIYRLLTLIALESPELVQTADECLRRFKKEPAYSVKSKVPNLGEFLIYLTISKKYDWLDIAHNFLLECDARNVFWYVKGNFDNPPKFPELAKTSGIGAKERCEKVFSATSVSRNLVLFQIMFVNVAKLLHISGLLEEESNFGLAPDVLRTELKEVYKKVTGIQNWDEYYQFLEMPPKTETERAKELVQALNRSVNQGYIRY